MHSSKLNVLAVALQVNADTIAWVSLERMSMLAQRYWTLSRSRISFWNHSLSFVQQNSRDDSQFGESYFARAAELLEEIIISQLHINVWGALWSYYDAKHKLGVDDRLGGLGGGIVDSHRETVHRANDFVLWLARHHRPAADRIMRLQRRIERWTDRLLANFAATIDVTPFCFDLERVREMLEAQGKAQDQPTLLMHVGGLQAAQLETCDAPFAKQMNHDLACLMLNLMPLNVLSELRLDLDTSVMRSDQASWEMDCFLEQALCLDLATTI